ncbi:DEAD/DEAH box RNA helicase, putative [Phytophthora infestans T30-4]|uniref:DEAD/DEAH box RNA helicase, putative n=1 Tax=Phytophthora infestans (strain T30-4) TaxID=403677 RepID=D0NFP0_PHYIT|nr:DEAD/DEAH box RNA helicase, putative [Phytophthora infestans T30-4]EEY57029.1 DEAD/DEAH box RNA helicase, putative [Phytophthora infestans T30-4]|eukprot:XP_002902357.1 DEAD/DEAH box RNA helicase, putative [Phytophthora infestans T30-4]
MEEDEWDDALLSEITALEKRHLQTRTQQNQTQRVWSCRSCTLQNEASRASCQVCSTLRGKARLSFDGTSAPVAVPPSQPQRQRDAEQDVGRSVPSPFIVRDRDQAIRTSQETTLGSAASGSGLVLTSRRSEQVSGAATAKRPASSPVQMSRHAAGEDSQARNRYLDIVARSNFPQIDYEAAQHFVYPTNYAIRDYQLAIAEKALYHNTLVSLPTGLGKTLVAAVVMYNFYRWFPTGKIVFMAPTKPLVAQQIKACHEIMGIPLSDTAELQGNVPPTMRRVLWDSRRVFFCTPQSLQNDLRRGVCAAEKFVCIVVDEAHRATGNYAYCCVVQEIEAKTPFFRVLALSATPGAKFDVIQDVVTNLRISHIESRSADDSDVKKYTHARQEEVIVCRLGAQIMEIKAQFLKFFTPIIQRLLRGDIIHNSDPEKLSSWYVLQAREKFRKSPNYASNRSAESDLALLVSLLHAKSLLTGHGLSSFRDQIMSWMEERKKGKMSWSKREMLQSPDHPKLVKLRQVLLEHFQRHSAGGSSTRAIVFTQYRASVSEIVALLRPLAPLLNAQPFIGQGATGKAKENKGQSQKVQQEIVRRFRLGEFNVLVATCIAEEGLDIGEVDLIVSFDALTSPVRMIQRMGRTGRKRVGRVIILVTEGDEQKKLARSASAAKTVSRALTTFKSRFTYSKCPRMIPTGICPQLRELEMKIPTFHASQVGGKTASVAVDPSLWQLSDAERAVALMKYFPPNFASSSRNKLFPVVANRGHLLRRQPRSLVQTSVGARVGYSTRSLMLQGLVRKIHGVEEILETASDDDEEKSEADGDKTVAEVSQNSKHR